MSLYNADLEVHNAAEMIINGMDGTREQNFTSRHFSMGTIQWSFSDIKTCTCNNISSLKVLITHLASMSYYITQSVMNLD